MIDILYNSITVTKKTPAPHRQSYYLPSSSAGHYLDQFLYNDDSSTDPAPTTSNSSTANNTANNNTGTLHLEKARALYDYDAGHSDELSLKTDDVISIVEHVDDSWLRGTLRGKTGIFPKNFVETFDASGRAHALYDYPGDSHEDLSFTTGDEIILLEAIDSSWFRGKLGNNVGMFPSNFVDVTVPIA